MGVHGFYLKQITGDSGGGATVGDFEAKAAGVAPAILWSKDFGNQSVIFIAKWLREFHVEKRLEGYHVFLDVAEVSRGKNCGCVCPSCETPLVARQGDVKEWHFAHASRDVYSQTKWECNYSFYVSVRMMARQIIEENLKIGLPEYKGSVGKFVDDVGEYIDVPFTIAEKQTVSLTKDSGSTMLKVRYQATLNTTGRWRNMS